MFTFLSTQNKRDYSHYGPSDDSKRESDYGYYGPQVERRSYSQSPFVLLPEEGTVGAIPLLSRRITTQHQVRVIPQLGRRTVTHQLRVIPQLGRRTAMHQLRVQTQLSRITVIPHRSRTITTLRVIPPFVTKMRTHQLLWWLTKTYFPSH